MEGKNDFKARIKAFAESQGYSIKGLQDELGLSNAHFQNAKSVTPRVGQKIKARFPYANVEWLNTGMGSMLLDDSADVSLSTITVPLLPVYAQAGALTDFVMQVREYECERIISPIKNVSIAMRVTGDSMSPEYPGGCIILLQQIDDKAFIEWGRTFVLDTVNGTVIKKVFPNPDDPDRVICRSVNPAYGEFEVRKADIFSWYIVRMQMSSK